MSKNKKHILLLSTLILVSVCLALVITPTFAHYFKKITEKAFWLTYESGNAVYVYGEHITEDDEWVTFDGSGFVQGPDSTTLDFSVANGVSREQFAERTQEVSIYLAVGPGIGDPEKIDVKLECSEGVVLVGKAEEIKEGNYLYSTFGPGWVYRFYDDNSGAEMLFILEGEEFCFENFTLTVNGTVEVTLLDLRITATYAQNK